MKTEVQVHPDSPGMASTVTAYLAALFVVMVQLHNGHTVLLIPLIITLVGLVWAIINPTVRVLIVSIMLSLATLVYAVLI